MWSLCKNNTVYELEKCFNSISFHLLLATNLNICVSRFIAKLFLGRKGYVAVDIVNRGVSALFQRCREETCR